MLFRRIYDPDLAAATYLIGCQRTGEALVIDPQRDIDLVLVAARHERLSITAVAETHIHADFLSGARALAELGEATLYLSAEGGPDWQYGWLAQRTTGGSYRHRLLRDGDHFLVGHIEIRVLHTPGHTPEHICFLITDRGGGAEEPMGLVSGDFVFVGDMGRPDLLETAAGVVGAQEASAHQLYHSARRFLELPDYLQLWPAHGAGSACGKALGAVPQSTVGYERRFNPALAHALDEQRFVDYMLEGQPEPPLYFGRMKIENRDGPPLLERLPVPAILDARALARAAAESVVLDTRPWPSFRAGHLPGALWCPLGTAFPATAGSYVLPHESIILVTPADEVERCVRALVRIGLDDVRSTCPPATFEAALQAGAVPSAQIPELDADTLAEQLERSEDPPAILDVRRAAEHAAGHLPGAMNIAHTRLRARLAEIPRGRPLVVQCQSGHRSALASAFLAREGFAVTNLAGGYLAWQRVQ